MPGIEQEHSLITLAERTRLLAVHVQAISAAVDLRRPQLYEREQFFVHGTGEIGLDFCIALTPSLLLPNQFSRCFIVGSFLVPSFDHGA